MKRIFLYLSVGLGVLLIFMLTAFQYSRSWEHAFFMDPLFNLATGDRVIALTFDDGPSAIRTPPLLEVLDSYQVKATFFMLGQNIQRHPDLAKAVFEQGHLIGNHSYDHPRMIFKSSSFIKDQITKTDSLIRSLGQEEVRYFRPPNTSKFIVLPLVIKSMGKELVTGTYDPPSEYAASYDAGKVAEEVIANAGPGSIIYLHDGKSNDPEQFVESLKLIITGLKKQGYRFVRLDYRQN